MVQPTFWLVMDQDGDGIESVLPSHAKSEQLAIVEALEHHEGRLIGVVPADWPIEPDVLCICVRLHRLSPRPPQNRRQSETITKLLCLLLSPSC